MNVVKIELERLGSVKVSIGLGQDVKRYNHEKGEVQVIKHYFAKDPPKIFMKGDSDEKIRQKFEEFIERVKGQTENWTDVGSGWEAGEIDLVYINVAHYQPQQGETYLPLPIKSG